MVKKKTLHDDLTAFLRQLKGLNSAFPEKKTANEDGASGVLNFVNYNLDEMLKRHQPQDQVQ